VILATGYFGDCKLRQGLYLLWLWLRGIHQLHRCCSTPEMSLSLACVAKLQEDMLFGAMATRKGWQAHNRPVCMLRTSVIQNTVCVVRLANLLCYSIVTLCGMQK